MEGYEFQSLKSDLLSDLQKKSTGSNRNQESNQTFNTEFPMPEPPMPNYSSSIYSSSDSPFIKHSSDSNFRKHGYITTKSGLVFRSADSTERALRELEIKKRQSRTKTRAGAMIASLFMLAMIILSITKNQSDALMRTAEADSTQRGQIVDHEVSVLQVPEEPPPEPVEEVIEEGKEFMQPLRYFAKNTAPRRPTDSNYFFHIPRSGGTVIKDIAGKCLGKVLATNKGVGYGHDADNALQVVEIEDGKYVNVDTTSIDGLHRATNFGTFGTTSSSSVLFVYSYEFFFEPLFII